MFQSASCPAIKAFNFLSALDSCILSCIYLNLVTNIYIVTCPLLPSSFPFRKTGTSSHLRPTIPLRPAGEQQIDRPSSKVNSTHSAPKLSHHFHDLVSHHHQPQQQSHRALMIACQIKPTKLHHQQNHAAHQPSKDAPATATTATRSRPQSTTSKSLTMQTQTEVCALECTCGYALSTTAPRSRSTWCLCARQSSIPNIAYNSTATMATTSSPDSAITEQWAFSFATSQRTTGRTWMSGASG